jgi:restriction endonuclease S subunit
MENEEEFGGVEGVETTFMIYYVRNSIYFNKKEYKFIKQVFTHIFGRNHVLRDCSGKPILSRPNMTMVIIKQNLQFFFFTICGDIQKD